MSGGKVGLMGENGPEAIMPLKRGKGGKLGVQVSGGNSITEHKTVHIHLEGVQDFESFRRSRPQLEQSARSAFLRSKD